MRKGNLVRYLRFHPEEYQHLARLWQQLDLGGHPETALKRLLIEALSALSPNLAQRISCLYKDELKLLRDHFRERTRSVAEHDFTPRELQVVLEACVSTPLLVRFVCHFQGVLVELFQEAWPELSRKVAQLSGHQFRLLYEQASRQSRGRG